MKNVGIWFPCWAHVLCAIIWAVQCEWAIAWFALVAAWFAFCWITDRPKDKYND